VEPRAPNRDPDRRSADPKMPTTWPPEGRAQKRTTPPDAFEGQRRQATVLFADMASFTPLAERIGEEKTYLLMRQVLQEMSEAVHTHEGAVQKFTGDGLMALFGVPIAAESAPVEACKAALDIQSRMLKLEERLQQEFGVRPKFRIGIHTGPLVVGKVGRFAGRIHRVR
jgi:class 3 adenylate cyclase